MAKDITAITKIELHWVGGRTTEYLVPANEVPAFVQATQRLHYSPGINPHTGGATIKIWKITSRSMTVGGPYWWTTLELQHNGDPAGARIIGFDNHETVLFLDEDSEEHKAHVQAELEEERAERSRLAAEFCDEAA